MIFLLGVKRGINKEMINTSYYKVATIEIIERFDWSVNDDEIVKKMANKLRSTATRLTMDDIDIETIGV